MTPEMKIAALHKIARVFKLDPCLENLNRCEELLELLNHKPLEFWDQFFTVTRDAGPQFDVDALLEEAEAHLAAQ